MFHKLILTQLSQINNIINSTNLLSFKTEAEQSSRAGLLSFVEQKFICSLSLVRGTDALHFKHTSFGTPIETSNYTKCKKVG